MKTSTISYLGGAHVLNHDEEPDVYVGFDPENGENVVLPAGHEGEVSTAKADQLAADFPGCFEVDGKVAGERSKPSRKKKAKAAAGDGDPLRDQLLAHSRDELNAAAAEIGVEAPEAMGNKAAVVDAILAKRAEDGDEDE